MTLQIGDAIGDGIRRSFTYSGGVLMALLFAYVVVFMGAMNALFVELFPEEFRESGQAALAFPIPPAVAAAILLAGFVFGIVLYVAATRALTREQSELSSLPSELFTRRIGRATLSALGANVVVQIAVTIGFVLLVVPGIFLAVSFVFVVFAIGVEDRRAIDSLSRSWELASGNRWRLFGLLLIVAVVASVAGAIGSLGTIVDPLVGQVVSLLVISVVSVVFYGVLADAYVQLSDEGTDGSGGTETPDAPGAAV